MRVPHVAFLVQSFLPHPHVGWSESLSPGSIVPQTSFIPSLGLDPECHLLPSDSSMTASMARCPRRAFLGSSTGRDKGSGLRHPLSGSTTSWLWGDFGVKLLNLPVTLFLPLYSEDQNSITLTEQ